MTNKEAIKLLEDLLLMAEFKDSYGDAIDHSPYSEAVDVAIEALETTTPKKPIHEDWIWKCPKCKSYDISTLYEGVHVGVKICQICGQRLDWEGLTLE